MVIISGSELPKSPIRQIKSRITPWVGWGYTYPYLPVPPFLVDRALPGWRYPEVGCAILNVEGAVCVKYVGGYDMWWQIRTWLWLKWLYANRPEDVR